MCGPNLKWRTRMPFPITRCFRNRPTNKEKTHARTERRQVPTKSRTADRRMDCGIAGPARVRLPMGIQDTGGAHGGLSRSGSVRATCNVLFDLGREICRVHRVDSRQHTTRGCGSPAGALQVRRRVDSRAWKRSLRGHAGARWKIRRRARAKCSRDRASNHRCVGHCRKFIGVGLRHRCGVAAGYQSHLSGKREGIYAHGGQRQRHAVYLSRTEYCGDMREKMTATGSVVSVKLQHPRLSQAENAVNAAPVLVFS